jgi:hypothetical protein
MNEVLDADVIAKIRHCVNTGLTLDTEPLIKLLNYHPQGDFSSDLVAVFLVAVFLGFCFSLVSRD